MTSAQTRADHSAAGVLRRVGDMKAVVCKAFGPPEDWSSRRSTIRSSGPSNCSSTCPPPAVTFPDTLMLEDKYQYKATPPYIPGGEVTGVVIEVGERVTGWSIGDRVVGALGATGGYAELCAIPSASARRLPDSVDFDAAAGLNYAYGTTLYGLQHRAELQRRRDAARPRRRRIRRLVGRGDRQAHGRPGDRRRIDRREARRLPPARRRRDDQLLDRGSQGASQGADGRQGHRRRLRLRRRRVRRASAAGDRWEGRFLVVGFTAGIPSIPLNLVLLKGCQIVGVFYGAMTAREPQRSAQISDQLIDWVADGKLQPYVSGRYPLERAGEALRSLMDRTVVGKVVITP